MILSPAAESIHIKQLLSSIGYNKISLRSIMTPKSLTGPIEVYVASNKQKYLIGILSPSEPILTTSLILNSDDDVCVFSKPRIPLSINFVTLGDKKVKTLEDNENYNIFPALKNSRDKFLGDDSRPASVAEYFSRKNRPDKKFFSKNKLDRKD